mmetsp:Transcript_19758/g.33968  ORF Transcript_19758/g.33968 Transcript_19758/m.33968 type:complete len:80 (-) Transcript_19758:553-792(-)
MPANKSEKRISDVDAYRRNVGKQENRLHKVERSKFRERHLRAEQKPYQVKQLLLWTGVVCALLLGLYLVLQSSIAMTRS